MSDTINALQMLNQPHGGGALPAPAIINPLAAIGGAMQTAGQVYDLRAKQADVAAGQAYQGAIDPATGQFDPQKFRSLLAANPAAAQAAGVSLANAQNISGAQLNQEIVKRNVVNNIFGTALTYTDPQQQQDYLTRQGGLLIRNGVITPEEGMNFFSAMPTDPAQRQQYLRGVYTQTLSPENQPSMMPGGAPQTVTAGNVTYTYGRNPVTGRPTGPTIATTHGPTPGQTTQVTVPMDDQGVIPQDANGVPARTPKTWQNITVPVTAIPGVPKGAPPTMTAAPAPPTSTAPPLPTGYKPRPAASTPPPAATAPPAATTTPPAAISPQPAPIPAGTGQGTPPAPVVAPVAPPPAVSTAAPATAAAAFAQARATGKSVPLPGGSGMVANPDGSTTSAPAPAATTAPPPPASAPQALATPSGAVRVASANPLLGPTLGPATPPSPQVAGDVNAMLGGVAQGRAAVPAPGTPAAPGSQTAQNFPLGIARVGPPMGTSEVLQNDIKTATDASLAMTQQRANLNAGEQALEALRLAKGYTGPGTATTARMYAFLQARDADLAVPQGNMNEVEWRQVLAKNLLRFAQSSGMRGNTDLGLQTAIEGNANVDQMLPKANEYVLQHDIGLQRQRIAQTLLMPAPDANGSVVQHFRDFTAKTDPRGFAWDTYSPQQQQQILSEVKDDPAAAAKLHRAIGMASRAPLNWVNPAPPATTAPPPPAAPAPTTTGPRAMNVNPLTPPAYAA